MSDTNIKNKQNKHKYVLRENIDGIDSFSREISRRSGFSLKDIRTILDVITDIFSDAITSSLSINITNLLSLYPQIIPPRTGVNAYKSRMTGEKVIEEFPEARRYIIRLSKGLRDLSKSSFNNQDEQEDSSDSFNLED